MNKEKDSFKVVYYSGYKREETPRAIIIGNRELEVKEVLWRKRVLDWSTGKVREVFKCRMKEGDIILEKADSGEWKITFLDGEVQSK